MGGLPEDLSALSFCKDRFCKNGIDPKIRVPSVPSVPRYGKYTWYTYFLVCFTFFFNGVYRYPVFGHRKSMVMETAKFLTAGRNHFTKPCFSKSCTQFTKQWVFSLFQTKSYGTVKRDMVIYGQGITSEILNGFWRLQIFHCSVHLLHFRK